MSECATLVALEQLPLLVRLLGTDRVEGRREELARLGIAPLWQVERDLGVLSRRRSAEEIVRAYRDLLRNSGQFVQALYEIRVAAMLALVAERIDLAPAVGRGRCDLGCTIKGQEVFFEISTVEDLFPFRRGEQGDTPLRARATVERSFDATSGGVGFEVEETPESQDLRSRIMEELSQLPRNGVNVVVIGSRRGRSIDVDATLCGDERLRNHRGGPVVAERVPNGLFSVADERGGASGLSAVVWLKLAPRFADVRIHSRLFLNPNAAHPLSPEVGETLRGVFDRRQVLERETDRVTRILVERYRPERIVLFGSLASDPGLDHVHEWSDIDLFIVKATPLPFTERIGEVLELTEPRVGVNVVVYTPAELAQAQRERRFFIVDEVLERGRALYP